MSEQVELELKIKGGNKAVKTLGQLEKELDKAREAIKGVEVGSKAFDELATQIQQASSEVKTLEKQMEGLEPQQKAEAFLKMGEGIAGGFAVGQGAMALMGVESENLEKIQVKVQSAIAIAMGVRMMSEAALMATTAKRVLIEKTSLVTTKLMSVATATLTFIQGGLATAITATSVALGVLRAAIVATGIGALVVGVGALVSSISSWASGSDEAADSQRDLAKEADILTQSIKDQLIETQKQLDLARQLKNEEDDRKDKLILLNDEIATQQAALKEANETFSEAIGSMKKLGASTTSLEGHLNSIEKTFLKNIETLKDEKEALEELIKTEDDAAEKRKKRREERKKQREEDAKNLLSLEKELDLLRIEDENERAAAKIEQDRQRDLKAAEEKNEQIALINEKYDILEAERKQKIDDAAFDKMIENNNKFNEERLANAEKQKEIDQKAADDKIALDKAVFDARRNMQANAFSAGAALFEKNKKISKAIAVSQTIFSTQQAIVDALAAKGTDALLPYPIRLTNAISAGVIGAASVRNILSESMGDVSASGGGGTPEPMIPQASGAFTLGGGVEQQAMKAFVVTDEMSDSQAQLADIRRRSTI